METEHHGLQELNRDEINEVLKKGFHAHLGCHHLKTYVVPMTYVYEGDYLYCHSRPGKKIDIMRTNPNVCVQVEDVKSLFNWRSVIVWGKFEELDELEAAKGMRLLIQRIADLEKERGLTPLEVELSAMLTQAVIYRIRMEEVSGRREKGGPD